MYVPNIMLELPREIFMMKNLIKKKYISSKLDTL